MNIHTSTPASIRATSVSLGGIIDYYISQMMRQTLEFPLTAHDGHNFAYYISPDLKPIPFVDFIEVLPWEDLQVPAESQREQIFTNAFKVSEINNPFSFPAATTYQVGNGTILALASNTQALSTGQFGEYPLLVFCSDGVFAMYVGGGQITYSSSRPLARDVCTNPASVKSVDGGVVFVTQRGLMVISGSEVKEISAPVEGAYLDFTNALDNSYMPIMSQAVDHASLVQLKAEMTANTFTDYIQGAIIAYNYKERELWIINPGKSYAYLYSNGMWAKVKETCTAIVEDYPATFLYKAARLIDVSSEASSSVQTMILSRPIKLGDQTFKQSYRAVLRGMYSLATGKYAGLYWFGSYDGIKWAFLGGTEKGGTLRDIGATIERVDCKYFRVGFVANLNPGSSIDYLEVSADAKLRGKLR